MATWDSITSIVVNAQQDPQAPWFLIGETFPNDLQSNSEGRELTISSETSFPLSKNLNP
jgi:hypothetical protein